MKVYIPNNKSHLYDLNSIVFKKDYKRKLIHFIKVDCVSFYGFKNKNTHTQFSGKVIKIKPFK
jgi:hypothetical protein